MKLKNYLTETKTELRHVNWPSRRQTVASALIVIVLAVGIGLLLGLFDLIFQSLLKLIV